MYRAVFFDLVNTLVRYDPPPEEIQDWICRQLGIDTTGSDLRRGFWAANDYFSRESARYPIERRSGVERKQIWVNFELILLREAGIDVTMEQASRAVEFLQQRERNIVLFSDTVPSLRALRERGLTVGLVSNLDMTLEEFCSEPDLVTHLDFAVVSHEVGCEKPQPEIFEIALKRAEAMPQEVVMVGDQYHTDIVGAQMVGIRPLWLDRDNMFDDRNGCRRIRSLMEILEYL